MPVLFRVFRSTGLIGIDNREVKIDVNVYGRPVTANGKLQFAFEGKFYKFLKLSTSF